MILNGKSNSNTLYGLISLFMGCALAILIIGLNGISPSSIGWFDGGDPLVHYLSWEFFRQSAWAFPIGLNPNYGLEIGSSIIYTDPIPLLAFLLKPFSTILPTPFQYLGLWTFMCIALQCYFGFLISKIITSNHIARLLIGIFFIFIPALLVRMGFHTALSSHFLILWAIFLIINRDKFIYWVFLISLAALINSYIFTMIIGLWFANALDCGKNAGSTIRRYLILTTQLVMICLFVLFIFWQSGYFAIPSESFGIGGFGIQRMNLLAPFNAQSWSYILPSIPEVSNDLIGGKTGLDFYARRAESFQYLGLGFLLLIIFSIPAYWSLRITIFKKMKVHWYLAIMLVAFILFAASNQIGISNLYFQIPLPDLAIKIASTWRASARFFWPITYILLIITLWIIFKWYKPKYALAILIFSLSTQILDTSSGWLKIRHKMSSSKYSTIASPLKSPFWEIAGKKYEHIKTYPLKSITTQNGWDVFGMYALKYRLKTNISYLARLDQKKIDLYNANFASKISNGSYDINSFYILDEDAIPLIYLNLKSSDLLARIDGYSVLAPNWYPCVNCPPLDAMNAKTLEEQFVKPINNNKIFFGKDGDGIRYLNGGFGDHRPWGYPESWGIWLTGNLGKVTIPLPNENAQLMTLQLRFPVSPVHQFTHYELLFSGQRSPLKFTVNQETISQSIPIPKQSQKDGFISLSFYVDNPIIPKDIGIGDDVRTIGLGLESIIFK